MTFGCCCAVKTYPIAHSPLLSNLTNWQTNLRAHCLFWARYCANNASPESAFNFPWNGLQKAWLIQGFSIVTTSMTCARLPSKFNQFLGRWCYSIGGLCQSSVCLTDRQSHGNRPPIHSIGCLKNCKDWLGCYLVENVEIASSSSSEKMNFHMNFTSLANEDNLFAFKL